MKKIIKLSESDLVNIIDRVISEQKRENINPNNLKLGVTPDKMSLSIVTKSCSVSLITFFILNK